MGGGYDLSKNRTTSILQDIEKYIYLDEESPTGLRWKVDRRTGRHRNVILVRAGDVAGCLTSDGLYYQVCVERRRYLVHRVVWTLHHGVLSGRDQIDHRDGNGLNNKPTNLRKVTPVINSRNQKKRVSNTSGVAGVSYHSKGYWTACWNDLEGRARRRYFSVDKLGDEGAKTAAIAHRTEAIQHLNDLGAGYTERHMT